MPMLTAMATSDHELVEDIAWALCVLSILSNLVFVLALTEFGALSSIAEGIAWITFAGPLWFAVIVHLLYVPLFIGRLVWAKRETVATPGGSRRSRSERIRDWYMLIGPVVWIALFMAIAAS